MPKILSYIQEASLFSGLFVILQQQHWRLFIQSTLQILHYSEKHSKYYLKALKSTLNIQKSTQRQSKALIICSTRPPFPIFQGRYCSFFNLNPAL